MLFVKSLIIIVVSTVFIKNMEMAENIQNYTKSNLKFSSSKLYFQHQNQILWKFWFISPMTFDIHYKYTFQEISDKYFIEWGEFEWLTADHDVHEEWIIYKIWFINPKFKNVRNLSVDLSKSENKSMLPLILTIVLWWVVFWLLYWASTKFLIWKILFWLNAAGAFIVFCFGAWQLWNSWYISMVKDKEKTWTFSVKCSDQTEMSVITDDILEVLKKISAEYRVIKFAFSGNCIYLLQDIHDHYWNKLPTSGKIYSEQEKAALQQKTMEFIRKSEFLSHFMED